MCYETNARPPYPPIAGGAATGEAFTLRAADGTDVMAFRALAERGTGGAGIVILPDVRGLHGFYQDLALRFAEAGVHATAFDYFGRTADTDDRGDDFDFWPHVMKTDPDTVAQDVRAAVEHMRSPEGGGAENVFTVGFCFGGRHSFNQAGRGHGLAGVIGFYGRVTARDESDTDAPVDQVSRYECPVLGSFGGADQGIPPESVEAFGTALDAAGIANDLKVYDGAPHSFFDRAFDQFSDECDDAWRRMLALIERS